MDYQRVYNEFIADRKAKEPERVANLGYFARRNGFSVLDGVRYEAHHIVPVHDGGTNEAENIVSLIPSEHFFAHLLLAKAHGGKHWSALWAMTNIKRVRTKADRLFTIRHRRWYELARIKAAENNTGKNNSRSSSVVCIDTGIIYESKLMAKKAGYANVGRATVKPTNKANGHYFAELSVVEEIGGVDEYKKELKKWISDEKQRMAKQNRRAGIKRTKWTRKTIIDEAKKYTTLKSFTAESQSAYKAATDLGVLADLRKILKTERRLDYDLVEITSLAKKCGARTAFAKKYPNEYAWCCRNNQIETVFGGIPSRINAVSFSLKELKAISKKYQTVMEFHKANRQAYMFAWKNNLMDELFPERRKPAPVVCLDTGDVFDTITAAVKTYGLSNAMKSKVGMVCQGKRKTAGGYRWAYAT